MKVSIIESGFLAITIVMHITCNYEMLTIKYDCISFQFFRSETVGDDELGGVVAEHQLLPLLSHLLGCPARCQK